MSKTYLPYDPDQQLLLPAALREWLPEDHLAYFISDIVDQLDLSEITARYEQERRGGPPYHPTMMVKVLLYAYCVGVPSSRRIATRLHEDIAFRVLAANTRLPRIKYGVTLLPHHLGFSQGPPGGAVGTVSAGAGVLPAGRTGEVGTRGAGRHQGQGQRIEAQGDELQAHEREGSAVSG